MTSPSPPPDGPARSCTRSWRRSQPAAQGVEVLAQGADHGPYHLQAILPETDQDNLTFTRSLPIAQATDPASGILIAYEMNGQPLGRDHGAPFRLIVPALVRRRVREVAEAARRPHRALHRRVPDRPLHLPVARPTPRARLPDAGTRPDHRPGTRLGPRRRAPTRSAGRHGPAPAPSPASTSASPARATGSPRSSNRPKRLPLAGLDASPGTPIDVGRHTLRARATDAAGNVQPDVPPWNRLGYGNNAIEVIYVDRTMTLMTSQGDDMDLFEIDETQHLRREEAAARLHALADALARNNSVEFERDRSPHHRACARRGRPQDRSRDRRRRERVGDRTDLVTFRVGRPASEDAAAAGRVPARVGVQGGAE